VTVAAGATEEIATEYEIPDIETGTVDLNASTPDDDASVAVGVDGTQTLSGTITDGVSGEVVAGTQDGVIVLVEHEPTDISYDENDGEYSIDVRNGSTVELSAQRTVEDAVGEPRTTDSETVTIDGNTTQNLRLWPELNGEGTDESPYNISNAYELQTMSQDGSAHYRLVDDIDASGTGDWADNGFAPVQLNGGSLNGDGHTISNLTISNESTFIGLFGGVSNSHISNLSLENASVTDVRSESTGLLAGTISDTTIENVRVTGTASDDRRNLGGLVGQNGNGGEIHNASANVSIDGEADNIGGLVGQNQGSVNASFAVGSVDGTETLGGLVGDNSGTVADSYWDRDTTNRTTGIGTGTDDGVRGFTTPNMTGINATVNTNLDFESAWDASASYPTLEFDAANADPVFELTGLTRPVRVATNETVEATVTVENVGGKPGTRDVSLDFDGEDGTTESVALDPGENETVTLEYDLPETTDPGDYELTIDAIDDNWTVVVEVNTLETVSGTLTDGVTSERLNESLVTIEQQGATQTDADGEYRIEVFNGTEITVSATVTADAVDDPVINDSETLTVDGSETVDLVLWPELDGEGTEASPYEVSNAYQLQAIGQDPGANYTLVDDVDAGETAEWQPEFPSSTERGFNPVDLGGSLDGDGHAITNLTVFGDGNVAAGGYVGLFGTLNGGHVSNLSVANATTDASGGTDTGLLVGSVYNGATVENVRITGTMRADADRVGPIGQVSDGEIRNVTADVDVTGNGTHVGGLVGRNTVSVENSSATGVVASGATDASVGGLVGTNDGTIVDTYATGTVSGLATVGGLVGNHTGDLETSYATGLVAKADDSGGLIGTASSGSTVSNAYWDVNSSRQTDSAGDGIGLTTAEMTGVDADETMGLGFGGPWYLTPDYPAFAEYEHAGEGTEDAPYEIGNVDELQLIENDLTANYTLTQDIDANETADWNAGAGFAPVGILSDSEFSGTFDGRGHDIIGLTINNSMASGVGLFSLPEGGKITNLTLTDVDITGDSEVGGVAGTVYDSSTVQNVSVTGSVEGTSEVGLLLGMSIDSTVVDSSADGTVNGRSFVGGLIGYSGESTVARTTASGVVGGTYDVGGLVGYNHNYGTSFDVIENSSSTADVITDVSGGGLVGTNDQSNVTDSYAAGNITGNDAVGGLVGRNDDGNVTDSYATGIVDGDSNEGGLVGDDEGTGTVVDAYWDINTTNQSTSAGDGIGLTTANMTGAEATTNTALDFNGTWTATADYPRLRWEDESLTFSLGSTTLEPGESTTATAELRFTDGSTVSVTETASYSSSDTGVATVDGTTITAVGDGTADITAQVGGLQATIPIEVETSTTGGTGGGGGQGGAGGRPPSNEGDTIETVTAEADVDGGVSATTTVTANELTRVDLGDSVSDDGSDTNYNRVDLTFGENTEVTFEARSRSRDELPDGTPTLGDNGGDNSGNDDANRAISYVEFSVSSDGIDASDQISSATIVFDVTRETLDDRGLDADGIALHRYNDEAGEWAELDTEGVSEGDQQVTYESTTPGFSMFAVGERADEMNTEPTDGETEPTESTDDLTDPTETNDDTPGFGLLVGLVSLLTLSVLMGRFQQAD